jgi:hypothetical protein
MLGVGQQISELKLGGVSHDRMMKWGKNVHDRKHISQRDLLDTKEDGYHFKTVSRI